MKAVFFVLIAAILIITCLNWFLPGDLTGGDSIFYFKEAYNNFSLHPYAWSTDRGAGLGETNIPLLWGYGINAFSVVVFGKIIGFDWSTIYRLSFYFPYLIISFFSAWYFAKKTIVKQDVFPLFAGLIYTANTYILMVMAGGQANYGLAYALIPLVLYKFIALFVDTTSSEQSKRFIVVTPLLRSSIITGVLLTIQMMFDIRVGYITLLAFGVFIIVNLGLLFKEDFLKRILLVLFYVFLFPFGIALLLLAYWIVPTLVIGANPVSQLGGSYAVQTAGVTFLSFAKFENTLSLLHPNWPENIFGKVYFMRSDFILLPILAFSCLMFLKTKNKEQKVTNRFILFLALLALLGAFLAKGTNDPFGGTYLWLFAKMPGFNAFRDPTKWYAFIAISYALLIPYTLKQFGEFISKNKEIIKIKKYSTVVVSVVILFLIYYVWLLRPIIAGQGTGTLHHSDIPHEYVQVKNFLANQQTFYRVLWTPVPPKYLYYSDNLRSVSAEELFNIFNQNDLLHKLKAKNTKRFLQEADVRYVMIPYDSEKQIFISDRKYDEKKYFEVVNTLDSIPWLKRIQSFGKVIVYEVPYPKDHFWIQGTGTEKIAYQAITKVAYKVSLTNAKQADKLIFSEGYDKYWVAKQKDSSLSEQSIKYDNYFNSFPLPKNGSYSLMIYYTSQEWVDIGFVISLVSFILVIVGVLVLRKKS